MEGEVRLMMQLGRRTIKAATWQTATWSKAQNAFIGSTRAFTQTDRTREILARSIHLFLDHFTITHASS